MTPIRSALPLIPPSNTTMSLHECYQRLAELKRIHQQAIISFWRDIPLLPGKVNPEWPAIKRNLYDLRKMGTSGFVVPDESVVETAFDEIKSQLSESVQARMQFSDFSQPSLTAVVDLDGSQVLVHRYDGSRFRDLAVDDLDVNNADGPWWFYQAREFGSEYSGDYCRPTLYVIGAADPEGDWSPKELDWSGRMQVVSAADHMESLLDNDDFQNAGTDDILLSFPSGVELELIELMAYKNWRVQQGVKSTDGEKEVMQKAAFPFAGKAAHLRAEIVRMQNELDSVELNESMAKESARLRFFGFEPGDQVVHSGTGRVGIICVEKEPYRSEAQILVRVDGEDLSHRRTTSILSELRLGEWTLDEAQIDAPAPRG